MAKSPGTTSTTIATPRSAHIATCKRPNQRTPTTLINQKNTKLPIATGVRHTSASSATPGDTKG